MTNPFIFGDPVRAADFLDRERELRRLRDRILRGASAIVTAAPGMGKTSLLLYLDEAREAVFGRAAEPWVFHYLDAYTMAGWDIQDFWREALEPLAARSSRLQAAYQAALADPDDISALEALFEQAEAEARRLVLLVDEFEALLHEPGLHGSRFYGVLRSLASRYPSFSLILSSRRSAAELNERTRDFAQGSPYFNFASEITLRPWPGRAVDALLQRGGDRLDAADRAFVKRIAGRHPYLLQAAAYYLWDMYEDETGPLGRRERAGREFFAEVAESLLQDIWRAWSPYMQMAFTLVGLEAMSAHLPDGRAFDIRALLRDLPHLAPELRKLEQWGFVRAAADRAVGYAPQAEVMVWYLAETLTRALRPEGVDLAAWLAAQEWQGLLKRGEMQALQRALNRVGGVLQEGVSVLIRAAAEGAARHLRGG